MKHMQIQCQSWQAAWELQRGVKPRLATGMGAAADHFGGFGLSQRLANGRLERPYSDKAAAGNGQKSSSGAFGVF